MRRAVIANLLSLDYVDAAFRSTLAGGAETTDRNWLGFVTTAMLCLAVIELFSLQY
jgi:hypothetical protein